MFQLERLSRVNPNPELVATVWLERGRDNDVAARTQLEAGKDLAVVNVRPRRPLVVVVHEVLVVQSGQVVVGPVKAEPYLQKLHLLVSLRSTMLLCKGDYYLTLWIRAPETNGRTGK